jgi:hypothetical protein
MVVSMSQGSPVPRWTSDAVFGVLRDFPGRVKNIK